MSDEQSGVSQASGDAPGLPPSAELPASIQDLPEDQRHELIEYVSKFIHVEQTTGHMPPPGMLDAYAPEVQAIIVDEFAQHGQHRRTTETTILNASVQRDRRGMWLGFFLAQTLLIIGAVIILAGYSLEGFGLIAADAPRSWLSFTSPTDAVVRSRFRSAESLVPVTAIGFAFFTERVG